MIKLVFDYTRCASPPLASPHTISKKMVIFTNYKRDYIIRVSFILLLRVLY